MSTITKRILWTVPLVFAAWIALMAGVMRFSAAAPAAIVPFPSQSLLAALPEDAGILSLNRYALVLANRADMTRALYDAGAVLVLPGGLVGCIPLSKDARRALMRANGSQP